MSSALGGEVEARRGVVAEEILSADHCSHIAGVVLNQDHGCGGAGRVARGDFVCKHLPHGCLGSPLKLAIHCGMNVKPAFKEQGNSVLSGFAEKRIGENPLPHFFHEIRRVIGGFQHLHPRCESDRLGAGLVVFLLRDVVVDEHPVEYLFAAQQGGIQIVIGVVGGRGLDQSSENGGFADGQIGEGFAEILVRCGTHPVCALAEIDEIQIFLEDELLGVLIFKLASESQLFYLAAGRLVGAIQEHQPHILLGDGGTAFRHAAFVQIGKPRSQDGSQINAAVLPETLVFNGDHGVLEDGGHFVKGFNVHTMLLASEKGDLFAVFVVDERRQSDGGRLNRERACGPRAAGG